MQFRSRSQKYFASVQRNPVQRRMDVEQEEPLYEEEESIEKVHDEITKMLFE